LKADLAEQAKNIRALKESGEIAPLAFNDAAAIRTFL